MSTTERTPTMVETPGTDGILTTAGHQQQQNTTQ
jgi:hypothetical protein